ncbi:tyrosine-type recombinase/integrase [Actinocatenispora sera]|uniref:Site-specific integrase n=1 Tax=Actinocatenispora sera TaxID=390989 RepID=A0A810L0J4_9ACTN|nr:tyrosine-type recombinase/integrase [Actinocatenispora sera]BCJ27961.1 site-specific integrase [Actinocatenispora sera]
MNSYDVQISDVWKRKDSGGVRRSRPYRLRWKVGGQPFELYYRTKALANSDRARLVHAANAGEPFDTETGRPVTEARTLNMPTWYEHARDYVAMKWPRAAAKTRRSMVEALVVITPVLTKQVKGRPPAAVLRRALYLYGLNPRRWDEEVPAPEAKALDWLARASLPLDALANAATARRALDACAVRLDGKAAAATTVARKRAVFYNALGYAVEREQLSANPIDKIDWKAPQVASAVDRRTVANPDQVAKILDGVRSLGKPGLRLLAFYACIYYTGARPSEVAYLKRSDCRLPATGWGRVTYVETQPRAGGHWTDDGSPREVRGLKHRPRKETREVPAPPELVALLREHIDREGVAADGRLFRSARGNPVSDSVYDRLWKKARKQAFTAEQVASPLARRPYDLRHAAASLWLNAGVSPTRVARRLGHSVEVLLRVYANCVDGDEELMNQRIGQALTGRGVTAALDQAAEGIAEGRNRAGGTAGADDLAEGA